MREVQQWRWSALTTSQAFILHLALSLLIFSSLIYVMALYWFPGELFFLDGGWQGLKLVAMVDLVLGPLLTLALYKPAKKGLVFDMSMIAALQIAALAYGFYTTHHVRTVGIVYADGKFTTLSNKAKLEADEKLRLVKAQPQDLPKVSMFNPPIVLSPAHEGGFGKYLEDLFNGYPEAHERSDRYIAISKKPDELRENALSEEELREDKLLDIVKTAKAKLDFDGDVENTIEVHRFDAAFASGVVLYDTNNNRILDYIKKPKRNSAKSVDSEQTVANTEDAGN